MLVQCTARRLHALCEATVMLKLDITKAFDTVNWAFLVETLRAMGFGTRWIDWVCGLLGSSSTRILVNGLPGRPIYNCCGLRQEGSLSPMLFILVMEPLHGMVELASSRGILAPLAGTGLRRRISMFADDIMLFIKPNKLDLQASSL
uniref:Reverse transcriptase domain-containing protein n=1 Tax=Triticum urartu TaxID=4572 RepID=A0A8R7RG20_TRIUA